MTVDFKVVIPARYASTRFPGKPLALIKNKSMLQHVYERACASEADEVIIATDDDRIKTAAENFGAVVCMTASEHPSGSDRLAEVAQYYEWDDQQIVVNVQGDEPQMPPAIIRQVAANLQQHSHASIATLCAALDDAKAIADPNTVKVVFDKNNMALYFGRSAVPYNGFDSNSDVFTHHYRHIGLYAYRASYLKKFTSLGVSPIEQSERLEQLRALWNGEKIHVDIASDLPGEGIDTPEDLARLAKAL